MRKILLTLSILILCASCNDKNKIDSIKADQDYTIVENNNDSFLDISKAVHSAKYFNKDWDNILPADNVHTAKAQDFINNGISLQEAYDHIMYFFQNRENLAYADFNEYCDPYVLKDNISNGQCIENKQKASNAYIYTFRSLLKARNMVQTAIDSHMEKKEESSEIASGYLLLALSYIAEDRFYEFPEIKKALVNWKKYGGSEVELFSDKGFNDSLTKLFTYIAYTDNIGVGELLYKAEETNLLNLVLSKGGYYNYFNDDYYTLAGISTIKDIYRVNSYYPEYKNQTLTPNAVKKLIPAQSGDSSMYYEFKTIYSETYTNDLWIIPFDSAVFLLISDKDKFIRLEFRNPAYIDTGYGEIDKDYVNNSGLPLILNIHNYKLIQKDFMSFENGKGQFIWNGDIVNQKPNPKKLFTLTPEFSCITDAGDIVDICKSREKLILAKYVYFLKCGSKKDCSISADDVDIYMNKQGLL